MRTLPYRLLFNRNIVQELIREGDASNRVFFLSDEEILTIRSALQRGADLTYPEISDSIMHWLDDMIEICSAVQECIETNPGVQGAINDMIAGGTQIPASSPYGQPLSLERKAQDLSTASNPGCDFDILWGQCTAIVDYTNSAIIDTLEKVEAASNVVELAKATLGTIPVEAGLEKTAGIDGVLEMVNYYQEAIAEEYAAQYTTTPVTGTRDIIAFDIFCACKSDCVITIERVQAVMLTRIEVYLSPPSIEGLVNLAEFLAGVEQDSSFVVDLAFFASWTMLAVSNYFFGGVGNNILDLVVQLAADEPDNGWEFMGDCAGEFEVLVYSDYARTTLKQTLNVQNGIPFTVTVDPVSWGAGEFFAVWTANKDTHYAVTMGTYTATIGEYAYAYFDSSGTLQIGTHGQPATNLPNDITTRGIHMNSNELDDTTVTFAVEITLNVP